MHRRLRILTFNRHEPYMYELAKTGHEFHVLLVDRPPWSRDWDVKSRPMPSNVTIVGEAESMSSLSLDQYDLILAQSYDDFQLVEKLPQRKMLLLHSVAAPQGPEGISRGEALRRLYLEQQLADVPVICVSHYVARNWGLPGRVILHSVDNGDYYLHKGEREAALTVAHFFKERDVELGYSLLQQVVRDDIPHRIVGHNPTLPNSGSAVSWEELKSYYLDYRLYLNTTASGGSMALLEAMAAGMPVVTTPLLGGRKHTVRDGHSGFVSKDPGELRAKVRHLLAHPKVAHLMGQRAKEAVGEKYGRERFIRDWQEALPDAISKPTNHPMGNLPKVFYKKAGLVSDPKASLRKALCWPGRRSGDYLLHGPFICLPVGQHEITFYVRLGERAPLRNWVPSFVDARLSRFNAKWGEGDSPLAVLGICSGSEPRVHAHRALHRSDFGPRGSYQGFKLAFESSGEKFLQFRVLATGYTPTYVDPYHTWASIRIVSGER